MIVRRFLGYSGLLLTVFFLEVLMLNHRINGALPILPGGRVLLVSLPVLLSLLAVIVDEKLLGSWPFRRLLWFGLAGAIIFLWPVTHYWILLPGLVVAYFVPLPHPRREGVALVLLLLTMHPFWWLWLPTFGGSLYSPLVFIVWLAAPTGLIGLLWAFERSVIQGSTTVHGLLAIVFVGFVSGVYVHWAWLDRPKKSRFRGTLPEVQRTASREALPHIIVISIDSLRRDMVPPYLHRSLDVPALEALRRDSIEFTRAFTTASSTPHSHASLFTGLLPVRHGTLRNVRIDPSVWLYPQLLKRLGYRTGGFTGGGFVNRKLGHARGYDVYWQNRGFYGNGIPGVLELIDALFPGSKTYFFKSSVRGRSFTHAVNRSLEWIDDQEASRSPLYLFLHTYQVHNYGFPHEESVKRLRENHPERLRAPLHEELLENLNFKGIPRIKSSVPRLSRELSEPGGERFAELYRSRTPAQQQFLRQWIRSHFEQRLTRSSLEERGTPGIEVSELQDRLRGYLLYWFQTLKWLYRYDIELTDRHLGRFLDGLKRRGLYEDSIIVFLSDHGEGFLVEFPSSGHGGQFHESLIRIPLWIKLPGNQRSREVDAGLMQLTDIFPSVFRYLNVRPEVQKPTWPDSPMRGLLKSSPESRRKVVFGSATSGHFVRSAKYKYIDRPDPDDGTGGRLLREGWFRVDSETIGQTPIDRSEVPADTRALLLDRMTEMLSVLSEKGGGGDFEKDAELREELRGLGYLR